MPKPCSARLCVAALGLLVTACDVDAMLATDSRTPPETASPIEDEPPVEDLPCHVALAGKDVVAVPTGDFEAPKAHAPLMVDGCSRDVVWSEQDWISLNYPWMGVEPDPADYEGVFKLAWTEERLYILVEVVDDLLNPTLADGLENYWKGDYVEVFLDEDRSGGIHQYNHQAFAYHVSTEGHAIDKDTAQRTTFFDDHVEVARTREGNRHLWEMAIDIYADDFDDNRDDNTPIVLTQNKTLGFSLAYGDNDGNQSRENFMGSRETHGPGNDAGYVNADVFGSIVLVE
ncbi:MAG: sugar-binding protein [Myxococcota bacterium]